MMKAKMVNAEKDEKETEKFNSFIDNIKPEDFSSYRFSFDFLGSLKHIRYYCFINKIIKSPIKNTIYFCKTSYPTKTAKPQKNSRV